MSRLRFFLAKMQAMPQRDDNRTPHNHPEADDSNALNRSFSPADTFQPAAASASTAAPGLRFYADLLCGGAGSLFACVDFTRSAAEAPSSESP